MRLNPHAIYSRKTSILLYVYNISIIIKNKIDESEQKRERKKIKKGVDFLHFASSSVCDKINHSTQQQYVGRVECT